MAGRRGILKLKKCPLRGEGGGAHGPKEKLADLGPDPERLWRGERFRGRYNTMEDPEMIRRIVACINGIELEGDDPFLQ